MLVKVEIKKQKMAPTKICKAFRIAVISLLVIRLVLIIISLFGTTIYFGGLMPVYITFILDLMIIGTAIGSINFRDNRHYILPAIGGLIILAIYLTNLASYSANTCYREFTSPDKKSTLVLRESGYLFSGETKFYKRTSPFSIKKLNQDISMDDAYQSIRKARLNIDWGDNSQTVILSYYNKDTDELLYQKELQFNDN